MMIVFLIFDHFVWKPQKIKKAEATEELASKSTPDAKADTSAAATSSIAEISGSDQDTNVVLQNDLVSIIISNRGARVSGVALKKYLNAQKLPAQLIPPNHSIAGTTLFADGGETSLDNMLFEVESDSERKASFYLKSGTDSVIVKTYTLNDDYGLNMDVKVHNYKPINGIRLSFDAGIENTERREAIAGSDPKSKKNKTQEYKFLIFADNQFRKFDSKKIAKTQTGEVSSFAWAAVKTKYFTIAIREVEPPLSTSFFAQQNSKTESPGFYIDSMHKKARSTWEQSFVLYMGPADHTILQKYGKGMENIAELGAKWLRWLSAFFAWVLKFLHSLIPNYGVVIIIFSFLIKIVLHPLTHKQLESGIKMQRIQPMVQEIQSKYKSDTKRMQAELSLLYKETGTNPMAGCLPLILQMPVFFTLYTVLRYSLDMRNAHFVGYLKDLSEPDPYLILPILMGVFMLLQSLLMQPPKVSMDQMDDKQKSAAQTSRMMTWIMPIMMFFVFRGMPAGLVLYWTVFNIFSVIQQYYLQKHFKQKES